ncbi:MAG: poly-gamma-glutamate hydrolase family protein, partial [Anaerolineaceae bacterium]
MHTPDDRPLSDTMPHGNPSRLLDTGGYRIEWGSRVSRVLIHTPHGGGIEPGTSEVVRALAGDNFSWYCFEGLCSDANRMLHVTSTRFDEPISAGLLRMCETVLAVHGCRTRRKTIFVGGLHRQWVDRFIRDFNQAGFSAERAEMDISGTSPRNLCNRGRLRKGVQIELAEGLRQDLFESLDRAGRR